MTARRMRSTLAGTLLVLVPSGAAAAADPLVSGAITWPDFALTGGTISFYPYGAGAFKQVTLQVAPGGTSATYQTRLVADTYQVYFYIGDCADAPNGQAYYCENYIQFDPPNDVIEVSADTVANFAPDPGFDPAMVDGTSELVGGSVVGGEAHLHYFYEGADGTVAGNVVVPLAGDGTFEGPIGAGTVDGYVELEQSQCVLRQQVTVFGFSADPGETVTLHVAALAKPAAPPPGRMLLRHGVVGFPGAFARYHGSNGITQSQDCAGGWSDPHLETTTYGATQYMTGGNFGSLDIQPSAFDVGGQIFDDTWEYRFGLKPVTVASNQTAAVDMRFDPAFIVANASFDWARVGPQASTPLLRFTATAASAGPVAAESFRAAGDDSEGVNAYSSRLPVDPRERWSMSGAFFFLEHADGTAANLRAVPIQTQPGAFQPVGALRSKQTVSYDLTAILQFGMGRIHFSPLESSWSILNIETRESLVGVGSRSATQHALGVFFTPDVVATVLQGEQRATMTWFDYSFGRHEELLTFDVRPNEDVWLSDSAPRIDDLVPTGGRVASSPTWVMGRVSDPDGIASMSLNGAPLYPQPNGVFKVRMTLPRGTSTLTVEAFDRNGHYLRRERVVCVGDGC